ncbi:hypothetical protein H7H53_00005 [Mycobacterium lacus]|nr:hypothetical protein [Mycobacterium lacus]MCV7121571.1 hypothetical protein [Mycobacterium lacus]
MAPAVPAVPRFCWVTAGLAEPEELAAREAPAATPSSLVAAVTAGRAVPLRGEATVATPASGVTVAMAGPAGRA